MGVLTSLEENQTQGCEQTGEPGPGVPHLLPARRNQPALARLASSCRPSWCACLLFVVALLTSLPAQSGTRVLDRIEVRSTSEGLEIHVTFNEPLRYTSHFPDRRSEVLQVDLRPVRAGDQEAGAREEVLTWTASAEVPLLEVSYDATTGQTARLTLSFSRLVDFRVEGDRDLRGVTIVLAQSEAQPETAAPDDGDAGAPPSASRAAARSMPPGSRRTSTRG